jgi:chromosome segregation ATPase
LNFCTNAKFQLASAQEDLDAKETALKKSSDKVAELEKENAEMKNRLQLIIEGNELKPRNTEEDAKARLVNNATIEALRQRAQTAERDAAVLGGLVSAMKQMLTNQWEQENGSDSLIQQKAKVLEQNQSVWEAEAEAAKLRAIALERQLQGKDETIQALRAQLSSRK